MALAGSRNANLGDALMRTAATGSATVDISFFPPNSDFNLALKLALGRLRNSAAMRTRGSMPDSTFGGLPSTRANIASTALLSCSIFFCSFPGFLLPERERLGIGTLHARPQAAERAELQLLHRALSLANLPRHVLNTFLLDKPQHHHAPLLGRQTIHQTK